MATKPSSGGGRRWRLALAALGLLGGLAWWKLRAPPAPAPDARAERQGVRTTVSARELRRWAADPAAPLASVAGLVHDPEGRPVAGARVVAGMASGAPRGSAAVDPWALETAAAAVTDADGRYALAGLRAGIYDLTATARGLTAGAREGVVLAPGEARTGVHLRLGREGATLSGRLLDSGGGVIAGGQVLASPFRSERVYAVIADGEGRFRLELPRGWYRVLARASGYAPTSEWISLQGDESKDLRLHAAARIAGEVVTDSGQPVPGATVRLVGKERTSQEQRQIESDAQGAFVFADLRPGTYELLGRKGPLVGRHAGQVAVELAGSASARIVLRRGRSVSGHVRGKLGAPIAQATVTAVPQALYGQAKDRLSAVTRPDGSFVLEGLFPGRFQLQAEAAGHAGRRAEVAVGLGDVSGLELVLEREAVVAGRVLDHAGKGVPDASVGAWLQTGAYRNDQFELVQTDAEGRFHIDGLPAGQLVLNVQHSAGIATFGPEALADGETKQVTLRLAAGAVVAGRVLFSDGKPAAQAQVRAHMMGGGPAALPGATTDAEGAYELANLLPGDVLVQAGLPGQEDRQDQGAKPSFARMKLAAGERRDGVDLTIRRHDLTIAGLVADDKGRPVEGAVLSAGPEYFQGVAGGASRKNMLTGADGRFLITDIAEDSYTVRAAHPSYPTAMQKGVRGGDQNVRLVLKAASALAGHVVASDGAPVVAYDILALPAPKPGESIEEREDRLWGVGSQRQSVEDAAGAFSFRGLPAGAYDLSVTTADRSAGTLHAVEVAEGASRGGLRVVVEGSTKLRGRVIEYGTATPIASAQIVAQGTGLDLQTTADQSGRFELVGVPRGGVLGLFVASYWETHVRENQEITVAPDAETLEVPDIKLQPGKLDWVSPDAGFTGLSPVTRDGKVTVRALRPGHPAGPAGIKVGDLVLAVNAKSVTDACASTVDFLLRGRAGEPVTVTVQSPGQAPRDVTFVRAGR